MQPVVLSLTCPKLLAALSDLFLMQHWEVLRRAGNPLGVHELAESCGTSDTVAQGMIDRLVEAGLAVRMKATAKRRKIVYRAIAERVVVEWDKDCDEHFAFLLEQRRRLRTLSRAVIDRHDDLEMRAIPNRAKFRGYATFSLNRAEAGEMWKVIRDAWEQISAIEARALKRAATAPRRSSAQPAATAVPPDAQDEHPYHFALELRPLKSPELPIADIGMVERQTIPRELKYISTTPAAVLTDREQQIARRLASGESRPEVAKALGLSPNTVASATKRIYSKLGVRNRAEFTARMRSA